MSERTPRGVSGSAGGAPRGPMDISIERVTDYAAVRGLGLAAGLEDTGHGYAGVVAAWGAFHAGVLVGGVVLERREGLDLLNWMAVDDAYRRRGIARRLVDEAMREARRRGIGRLWVTARAPGFFRALGFEDAPTGAQRDMLLGGCLTCDQYGNGCYPRVLFQDLGGAERRRA